MLKKNWSLLLLLIVLTKIKCYSRISLELSRAMPPPFLRFCFREICEFSRVIGQILCPDMRFQRGIVSRFPTFVLAARCWLFRLLSFLLILNFFYCYYLRYLINVDMSASKNRRPGGFLVSARTHILDGCRFESTGKHHKGLKFVVFSLFIIIACKTVIHGWIAVTVPAQFQRHSTPSMKLMHKNVWN